VQPGLELTRAPSVGCDLRHMARHASAVARICVVVR
jgi:hypothetical protein